MEYNKDLEAYLREVTNEFQNLKLGMAETSFEESVHRLIETAIGNISSGGRARGGNYAQGSARFYATSHHTDQNMPFT